MNVLFLSSWYPNKTHETLGNFVQRHAEAVALLNEVTVLYLAKNDKQKEAFEIDDRVINGVRTVIIYFKPGVLTPVGYRKAFKYGLKYLGEEMIRNFDLVHHNVLLNQGWQALYLKKRYSLPYVITEHWTGFHDNATKRIQGARRILAQMVAEGAEFILPVSNHLGNAMREFGLKGNYIKVENVVDTDLFVPAQNKKLPFKFLHVSHLGDRHKNVSGLINAFSGVLKQGANAVLHIVGDGDIDPYIKLRNDLGISEKDIYIEGELPLSGIAQIMGKSDAFVLFSNYENLPCVIIEAFSAGVPVISTDVGGVSEMLDHEKGYLIEKGNEKELTEVMLAMITEEKKFNRDDLRNYAISEFSKLQIARKFNDIYARLN